MSDCCHCIEVATPQSIYDEGEGDYPVHTDIFAEIFDDTSYTYGTVMEGALWARYRYYMIGSCDIDTWVQVMRDKLALIGDKWDALLDKVLSSDPIDLTDLNELSYRRTLKRQPISGTSGDVRTVKDENEDLPQTLTDTTKYLTNRHNTTDTYVPNTQDTEEYSQESDLMAATFDKLIEKYPDYLDRFADEFKDYFIQRW